jgi:hypothetical protein
MKLQIIKILVKFNFKTKKFLIINIKKKILIFMINFNYISKKNKKVKYNNNTNKKLKIIY